MAWTQKWALALGAAAWVVGTVFAKNRNPGIGLLLCAGTWNMLKDYQDDSPLPPDDIVFKLINFSLVVWPGGILALALPSLFEKETARSSLWMVLSPLPVVLLGMPVLRLLIPQHPLRDWRIFIGLATTGIVAGHFLSHSNISGKIDPSIHAVLSLLAGNSTLTITAGAGIIMYSTFRMIQSRSGAGSYLQMKEKLPTDSLIPMVLPPGFAPSWLLVAWTIGLAICVGSTLHAEARAALVSASVAITVTIAVSPPFPGKVWLRSDTWLRLLFGLQVAVVLSAWGYNEWERRLKPLLGF